MSKITAFIQLSIADGHFGQEYMQVSPDSARMRDYLTFTRLEWRSCQVRESLMLHSVTDLSQWLFVTVVLRVVLIQPGANVKQIIALASKDQPRSSASNCCKISFLPAFQLFCGVLDLLALHTDILIGQ